jgi:uncharacterized sporulation protein YeaH/YhbH (DUF444 family)
MVEKNIKEWSVDEVCIWLNCIGLGEKVDAFRDNTVDGETLLSLSIEDMTGELGLSNLQAKKVIRMLTTTQEILSIDAGGLESDKGSKEAVQELEDQIRRLKLDLEAKEKKIKDQEQEIRRLTTTKESVPVVQAQPVEPPTPHHSSHGGAGGRPVVRGAAVGAAGGALKVRY